MSSEFTCKVFMKVFLPAHFSWIWCKCLWSNFVHNSKIFQSDWMQGRFLKYSLLRISHRLLKHFPEKKNDRKCKRRLRIEGIIKNKYTNAGITIIKKLQWYDCVKIPKNICKVHKTSTKRRTIGNVKLEIRNNNHSHGQRCTFFECQWI